MDDLWEKGEVFRLLKGSPGTQYQEATDTERKIIRDWIRLLLQKTAARIDFVKSDGTVRQMHCTLDQDQIPVSTAKPVPATNTSSGSILSLIAFPTYFSYSIELTSPIFVFEITI